MLCKSIELKKTPCRLNLNSKFSQHHAWAMAKAKQTNKKKRNNKKNNPEIKQKRSQTSLGTNNPPASLENHIVRHTVPAI